MYIPLNGSEEPCIFIMTVYVCSCHIQDIIELKDVALNYPSQICVIVLLKENLEVTLGKVFFPLFIILLLMEYI